jgi:outer membrane protein assembly factor BamB
MWFGTRDGLNKYDGYGFVVYKNAIEDTLSISGNDITGLVEDQAGDIWITTSGGGLNRFDRSKNRFIHYQGVIPPDLISGPMLDDSGRIWVGSTEGGVFVLEPATGKVVSFSNDPKNARSLSDNNVTAICKDSHHQIWIGTLRGGLNLYDGSSHSFTRYQHRNKDTTSLGGATVAAVFEDGTIGYGPDCGMEGLMFSIPCTKASGISGTIRITVTAWRVMWSFPWEMMLMAIYGSERKTAGSAFWTRR